MLRPVRRRPIFVEKNNQPETFYLDIRLARQRRGALGARIEVSRFGSLGRVNNLLTRVLAILWRRRVRSHRCEIRDP